MTAVETSPLPDAQIRSQGIALRRGLTLLGMTLIVPGSAQLAGGNERLGRFAARVWVTLVVLALLFGALFLTFRAFAIGLYVNPVTLQVLRWASLVLGLGWALLFVNAWRIANPPALSQRGKVILPSVAFVLALAVAFGSWTLAAAFDAQSRLFGTVFTGGGKAETSSGRYNVLLLGGDAGADRDGLRPDTMMVASIDANTGRTVLFSLPRNLQWAPFPDSSPLKKLYPNGYWCKDQSCLLNAVYTLATNHKSLYPGVKNPGVQATKEVIENILGLQINYWALIDLKGFKQLIDAVGGIDLDVARKVPIGGGTDLTTGKKNPIKGYIGPGKNLHLDGYHALWFARSREGSTDYERMARQKCVLNAMAKQLNPLTVLTKFQEIAKAGEEIVATDLPTSQIGTMLDLAQRGRSLPLSSVSFAPPLILPVKPDFAKIRQIVAQKIAASEAAASKPPKASTSATPSSSGSSSTVPSPGSTEAKTQTDDLDDVCTVS
ncbi:MAG: LCP family protein [Micropruina sp.]|uniref:LCP family protein n=1 Tax=Micropruina sp. TaxID=2737536 RepID=UPI0039E33F91